MAKVKYKISARATILLGREGVSKADGAMVELIKNTYDADADLCFMCIDEGRDKMYLFDNGTGMDLQTIQDCWMLIGTANKRDEYQSAKNRIKSGEKGIGRFALDRLGSKCTMYTKNELENKVLKWSTNWADFENTDKTLDEMEADIDEVDGSLSDYLPVQLHKNIIEFVESINNRRVNRKIELYKTGTLFVISGLRDDWEKGKADKFIGNLGTLLPPKEQSEFYIGTMSSLADQYKPIENSLSDDFDYKIKAEFDGENFIVNWNRNEFDLNMIPREVFEREKFKTYPYRKQDFVNHNFSRKYTIKELLKTNDEDLIKRVKKIGSFSFDYNFMKVTMTDDSKEIFYYKEIGKQRRKWLAEYGGIKIYRDNFFVRPYGDPTADAFDWLGLDTRRAKNPAAISHPGGGWHVSNRQSQGTVFISRVANQMLLDKSSREGIIENEYFAIFKNVLTSIIAIFERDRAYIGKAMREYSDEVNEKEKAKAEAKKLAEELLDKDKGSNEESSSSNSNETILAKAVRYYEEELEELLSEIQQLKALATNGLITSTVAHDLKTINGMLVSRVDALRKQINNNNRNLIDRHLNDLKKNDEFLKSWLTVVSSQAKKDRRTRKNCNVYDTLKHIVGVMNPILLRKQVDVSVEAEDQTIERYIFQSDFESILYNLIINTIEALETCAREKRNIILKLTEDEDNITIQYDDNGPGLHEIFTNPYEIFNYGTTSKQDKNGKEIGTGMGMYIVASTLREYNAKYTITNITNGFGLCMKIPRGAINGKKNI